MSGGSDQSNRPAWIGASAGGGVLLAGMLMSAAIAVATGAVRSGGAGAIELGPWLRIQLVVGAVLSVGSGWISRRVARSVRAPVMLALVVAGVGLVESAELLRHASAGRVTAAPALVIAGPILASLGVLAGGGVLSLAGVGGVVRRWRGGAAGRSPIAGVALVVVSIIAGVVGAAWGFPRVRDDQGAPVVAAALAVDLTIVPAAVAYLVLARARHARWVVLVPILAVGYLLATVLLPDDHQASLGVISRLLIPIELGAVAAVIVLARRALAGAGAGDFYSRVRVAADRLMGRGVPAGVLATEVSILFYSLAAWGSRPTVGFTLHKGANYHTVVVGLVLAIVAEALALHLLIAVWSTTAAWIATGLSAYGMLWLVGDARAIARRPILIEGGSMAIRLGIRADATVPLDQVLGAEPWRGAAPRGSVVLALLGEPNVRLDFSDGIQFAGLYGLRRRGASVWLRVDDPEGLLRALAAWGVERRDPQAQPAV